MIAVYDLNLTLHRAFIFLEGRFLVFLHTVKNQKTVHYFIPLTFYLVMLLCDDVMVTPTPLVTHLFTGLSC